MFVEFYITPHITSEQFEIIAGQLGPVHREKYHTPTVATLDFEVRDNWDRESEDFLGWPTLAQFDPLAGADLEAYVADIRRIAKLVREAGYQVVVSADFEA